MSESFNLPDRSIGKKLKDLRQSKDFSLAQVSHSTKIRTEYLEAIERDDFTKFDSHVYAKGFIRNYALFLGTDPSPLIALYRRDFENVENKRKVKKEKEPEAVEEKKKVNLKIKSDVTKEKIAYGIIAFVLLVFSITLVAFLQNTFQPPMLKITSPEFIQNETYKYIETAEKSIRVAGETESGSLIKINEEPVAIKPGFTFESDFLPLTSERNIVNIEAVSQLGVKTTIQLEIVRTDLKDEVIPQSDTIVVVKEKPIFLLIRADGIIKFNDIAVPNEAINITADKFIEIETSEPQYASVQIGEDNYQLERSFERFEFGDEIKRLSQ